MSLPLTRRQALFASIAAAAFAPMMVPAHAMAPGFTDYSKEKFDAILKGDKPVLVHVHADWCPVCVRQERTFNEIASSADYKKLVGVKVSFDMDLDFRKAHNVNNQSVLILFKGGKEVARAGGISSASDIAEFISKGLAVAA
jgi:thiol-disulfide isomerase/thioredoxin